MNDAIFLTDVEHYLAPTSAPGDLRRHGSLGTAPAIIRFVGHRLATARERQPEIAPGAGAALEDADRWKLRRLQLGCREPRQDRIGRDQHQKGAPRQPREARP